MKGEEVKKPETPTPFKLYIDDWVWDKVMYFIDKSSDEISGMGLIIPWRDGYRVVDTYLLEQENTGSSTDIEPESVNKLQAALKDAEGMLRWWWHSHVNMTAFWSGTDKDTMEELGRHGWFISTVINKRREKRTALYGGGLLSGHPLFIDNIDTEIQATRASENPEWEKEYKDNVKTKKWEYLGRSHEADDYGKKTRQHKSIKGHHEWMLPHKDTPELLEKYEECEWSSYMGLWRLPYNGSPKPIEYWDWVQEEWVTHERVTDGIMKRDYGHDAEENKKKRNRLIHEKSKLMKAMKKAPMMMVGPGSNASKKSGVAGIASGSEKK